MKPRHEPEATSPSHSAVTLPSRNRMAIANLVSAPSASPGYYMSGQIQPPNGEPNENVASYHHSQSPFPHVPINRPPPPTRYPPGGTPMRQSDTDGQGISSSFENAIRVSDIVAQTNGLSPNHPFQNGYPRPSQGGTRSVVVPHPPSLSEPAQPIPLVTQARLRFVSRFAPVSTNAPQRELEDIDNCDGPTNVTIESETSPRSVGNSLHDTDSLSSRSPCNPSTPKGKQRRGRYGSGFRQGHTPLSPDADVDTTNPGTRKQTIGARKRRQQQRQEYEALQNSVEIDLPRRLQQLIADEDAAVEHANIKRAIYEAKKGLMELHGIVAGRRVISEIERETRERGLTFREF